MGFEGGFLDELRARHQRGAPVAHLCAPPALGSLGHPPTHQRNLVQTNKTVSTSETLDLDFGKPFSNLLEGFTHLPKGPPHFFKETTWQSPQASPTNSLRLTSLRLSCPANISPAKLSG